MTETKPIPRAHFGAWRREPVTRVGRIILPATFNEGDRAQIDVRLSKIHAAKAHNNDTDRPTN